MKKGIQFIRHHVEAIGKFVETEKEIFSNPHSNFRQLRDMSDQGYVTFIALEDSIREVLIDSTETSPTFSTYPIRKEDELNKKRSEFRAYLVGKKDNLKAWQALLGREIDSTDVQDAEKFLLAYEAEGNYSYKKRPLGKGNFLIAVAKLKVSQHLSHELKSLLQDAKREGGQTGLIIICRGKLTEEQAQEFTDIPHLLFLEDVPFDHIGFVETIILKQTLNLISNGSMVLMNKVHGNRMIDVRASNHKLIDRCMRLVKDIWSDYRTSFGVSDKDLYHYIAHVSTLKKSYEEQGIYTPSIVKILLAMLTLKKTPKDFQEVVDLLNEKQERVDWIAEYN